MRARCRRRLFLEPLEDRRLLAAAPYQNAADPYDVNADGAADGTDLWLLDTELKARGERSLTNPNGPVQYFWDVNGDRDLTWADLELDLRYQTGTLQSEAPKSGGGKTTGSGDGGITTLSGGYTVTLDPVSSVNEGAPFSLVGTVSPTPPPNTMFMPMINWGQSPGNGGPPMQVMIDSQGHFQIGHIYFDDGASPGNGTPSDLSTITLSGSILGWPVSAQTTATVYNVNPVPQILLTNTNDPQGGPEWQVSGTIQDASPMDKHTVTIDWGDGSVPTVINNVSTNQLFPTNPTHRYAPRQIHEVDASGIPLPYVVTATVVDDDTGQASWSDNAPSYVFDLDNDADNSWTIDANDDPIEHVLPGRFLYANWDDDNTNGIPDVYDAPIPEEDDLEPFLVGWTPRPDFDYTGWHLTLHVMQPSVSGTIWEFRDKSGDSVPFVGSGDLIFDWLLDTQPIQQTLYLEADAPGEIWLQLRLWTPSYGLTVEEDRVVFTALAPDQIVDMIIYDGQDGREVRDEDGGGVPGKGGAVTVANRNDTDADRITDFQDDIVKETRTGADKHGRDEVDLMKVEIKEPTGYAGGAVHLVVNRWDTVALWDKPTKEERAVEYSIETGMADFFFDPANPGDNVRTVWVELIDESESVADYEFTLTYGTAVPDVIKATGVWSTLTDEEFSDKTWDQLANTVWRTDMDAGPQKILKFFGGTGVRDNIIRLANGLTSINNVMVMQFTVSPVNVEEVLPRVVFDVTRQIKTHDWKQKATAADPENWGSPEDFPLLWEEANDDPDDTDESPKVNASGRLYVIDVPRLYDNPEPPFENTTRYWQYMNFWEFTRVRFTGKRPTGDTTSGSQSSSRAYPDYAWHSRLSIRWNAADRKWERNNDTGVNDIAREHILLGVRPY